MMPHSVYRLRNSRGLSILRDEGGYLLIVVTIIGLILGVIFGVILPQLHTGQQSRAANNLNEYRACEAARRGVHAVELGLREVNNFQDMIGYGITAADETNEKFTISGNYASLFAPGAALQVYFSANNSGSFTVSGATNVGATTEISLNQDITSGTADGILCRNRGIFRALHAMCGATASSTNHDEYRDEEGNVQFVSGCRGIDLLDNEDGRVAVFVIVSRNGVINTTSDGDPKNDGWYFHDTNSGVSWVSVDRWPWVTPTVDFFEYVDGNVHYYDFDMKESLGAGNYHTNADLKCERNTEGRWFLSIGNNGTWRRKDGATELWQLERDFSSGGTPFQMKDNDGDGDIDDADRVEVFVVVRSTGITIAPGTNYAADKRDLRLVREANPHLPNPMRQVLEAAFAPEDRL